MPVEFSPATARDGLVVVMPKPPVVRALERPATADKHITFGAEDDGTVTPRCTVGDRKGRRLAPEAREAPEG
jgi:hypothetical protein